MLKRFCYIIMITATSAGIAGCKASSEKTELSDDTDNTSSVDTILPETVKKLTNAVEKNDAESFASIVSYPLERPYPLRDIADSITMKMYYPIMVDDSIKEVITNAEPENWSSSGWRGWTLHEGQYIWIDEKIYQVNYLSKAEKALMDMLVRDEMESVPSEYRKGWVPTLCLSAVDGGEIFRIDRKKGKLKKDSVDVFRLAIYKAETDLAKRPDYVLEGNSITEGTAGIISYEFNNQNMYAKYINDATSDEAVPQIIFRNNGEERVYQVKNIYWRDYVMKPGRKRHRHIEETQHEMMSEKTAPQ